MSTGTDPLAPLAALPGVPESVAEVRKAVDRLYGHRVMRRRAPEVTSEAALRGARASAALAGADWPLEEVRRRSDFSAGADERVVGGALRISAEAGQLLSVWRTSPLQVLARLHLLAAGDASSAAGRPRQDGEPADELFPLELAPAQGVAAPVDLPAGAQAPGAEAGRGPVVVLPPAPPATEVAARLDQLAQLLAGRTAGAQGGAPALVTAAVVHGELLALRPFGSHNGLVARAAQRIVLIAEGLDPKAICPAEVGLVELGTAAYREALAGYLTGTPEGLGRWIAHCAAALRLGVRESTAVCEAMQRGMV
ncbi:Fic family protein [Kitasatospora sp. NBC_01287]|uniref:Fic family protein n=1 Tax=Kitasatospora sp. NBC_01287 TaxID=2903573 RepID=UPI0022551EED|nr:Fic family protein [Kitasatospora sp. NBC_01287]MCX4748121.1 Fic family protein [Kitasatospora sp. NBC_01287]